MLSYDVVYLGEQFSDELNHTNTLTFFNAQSTQFATNVKKNRVFSHFVGFSRNGALCVPGGLSVLRDTTMETLSRRKTHAKTQ